jgi:hypothetical protein
MKKNFFTNNILLVIVLIILSVISGFLGSVLSKNQVIDSSYFNPFNSELNLSGYNYNPTSLVIRDPKKVVVSQDVKIIETANTARENILYIFYKEDNLLLSDDIVSSSTPFLTETNIFNLADFRSSALALTSDGWLLAKSSDLDLSRDLIAIDVDRNIYEIDKKITFFDQGLLLAHLYQATLSPTNFSHSQELNSGQSLLLVGQDRQMLSYLLNRERDNNLVKSSDNLFSPLILSSEVKEEFASWLFDFQGDAVAVYIDNKWLPLDKFNFFWQNALSQNETDISAPNLGINYIDLSKVAILDFQQNLGALIYPNLDGISISENSPADLAGLKAGDIIRAVGSVELNEKNDLAQVLSNYLVGDSLDLTIFRDDSLMIVKVELKK